MAMTAWLAKFFTSSDVAVSGGWFDASTSPIGWVARAAASQHSVAALDAAAAA